MSIISDPYKSFKDQALRIWDTKDFANRLAFSNTGWFLAFLYWFMAISILWLFIIVVVNDLFILAKYYSEAWYLDLLEDVFFETVFIQMILFFFWTSDKVVRLSLSLWKMYSKKEVGFFHWLEVKIKQRFPSFKTSAQRSRERLNKPKKETKTGKWLLGLPRNQRRLIRLGVACFYGFFIFTMVGTFAYPDVIWFIFTGQEIEKPEKPAPPSLEFQLENQEMPKQPDGRPPPTIYDIFIRQSDSVVP